MSGSDATVGSVGERALIRRIRRITGPAPAGTLGIGDDAAVVPAPGGRMVLTVDVQVEGTHFLRTTARPEEIGWKSLAVNLSDVAAMGAAPSAALVSLVLPSALSVASVDRFYRGLMRLARREKTAVVGGNIARGESVAASVTVTGRPLGRREVLRSGSSPGDRILVSGIPGLAHLGRLLLEMLCPAGAGDLWTPAASAPPSWRGSGPGRSGAGRRAIRAFLLPEPRTAAGRELRPHRPSALIDTSDGLARDLAHLVNARCAPRIRADSLRFSPALARLAGEIGVDPLEAAVQGGEDYELLFTLPPAAARRLAGDGALAGIPVREIGVMEPGLREPVIEGSSGVRSLRSASGWHFPAD